LCQSGGDGYQAARMPSGKDILMIILLTIIVILLVWIVAPGLIRVLFYPALMGVLIAAGLFGVFLLFSVITA
jgi:hypothetical protein